MLVKIFAAEVLAGRITIEQVPEAFKLREKVIEYIGWLTSQKDGAGA